MAAGVSYQERPRELRLEVASLKRRRHLAVERSNQAYLRCEVGCWGGILAEGGRRFHPLRHSHAHSCAQSGGAERRCGGAAL